MENIIDLFHTVSVSPWRDKYLNSFLCGCSEHQVFICNNTSKLAHIAAEVNSKLNNGNSRTEGLLILKTFLSQCPDEIFYQNAFSWASQTLNATEGRQNENNQNKIIPHLPLVVLRQIVELSGQFPTVIKQLLPVVSKLLRQLTGYEIQDIIADSRSACILLQCLQSCMKYYSAQCLTYKGAIEKLLLGLIFCTNESVIDEASKCFLLLSLINSANVGVKIQLIGGGNGYCTLLWNQMLSKLVATMNFALNELYENAPTFKMSSLEGDKFDVPIVAEENPVLAIQASATLYINLGHYLSSMLTNPLPAAKSIPLEDVLGVVCQALAVTCSSLKDQVSAESYALSVCIPQVHVASFSILSSLMACSRLNLLAFGPLIIKLVMQSLKWTGVVKDWPSGVKKPYSSLRCSIYSCLSLWLRISASASSAEEVAEELIGIALSDIVPSREKMTLMTSDSRKKLHGKRHKRQKVVVSENSITEKSSISAPSYRCALGNGTANSDVCFAALEVLTYLLYSVGPFLKPNQHKILQEKTVSVLVDIQRSSNYLGSKDIEGRCNGTDLILPYQSDARCRLSLYKLLLALVMEPHSHKWPPPLGIAAKLFEDGLNDPNLEVSTFCLTSKRTVERILHPCVPTLNFPVTLSDMGDKQPAYLNSLINRIRSRESSVHENSVGEEENILKEKRNLRQSFKKIRETMESAEPRQSSTSESRSSSPEIITISDEPYMSPKAHQSSKSPSSPSSIHLSVVSETPNCGTSDNSTSDSFVLVRRVERCEGRPSIQEVKLNNIPLTTIQSIGVQASHEQGTNDLVSSTSSSAVSQSDKVLVLKLPIDNSGSEEFMKDFTQQWKADKNSMEIGQSKPLEGNMVSKVLESHESEPVNGCEVKSSNKFDLASEEVSHGLKNCEEKNPAVVVNVTEDISVSKKSPVVTQEIVELDVEHLSESEEMISCFVDTEPDTE